MWVLSLGTLLFVSCKKEDKAYVATKENLTGSYKITGLTYAGVNVINHTNEDHNVVEACERDDLMTLNANSTYIVTDAGTACDPSSDDTGSWEFVSSTSVTIDGETGTIKSWNGKTLVVEAQDSGVTVVTTLSRQ